MNAKNMFSLRPLTALATALICALTLTSHFQTAHAERSGDRLAVAKTERIQFKSLPGYTRAQTQIANKIASRFAAAGYGRVQQIAAVSVAIRESTLNPKAHNRGCRCYGLFQMNRGNGLGNGHSAANLTNADYNIRLIIGEANRFQSFKNAKSIDSAVNAFVRHVTRPANKSRVVRATVKTARMVERSASAMRLAASK
ncbi:MAG: phage tail tip lysozyme [Alphaproteobacteria bacterium]|nr:phage tail tip lysozyme [Alphaproteobacteria bacterium]